MNVSFRKMHGLGNDFMVVDTRAQPLALSQEHIAALADRHTGVGFDQLLMLSAPSDSSAQARYQVFNADGTEVEQCGNGVRCLAWLLATQGGVAGRQVVLEGAAGLVHATILKDSQVRVAMGEPDFSPAALPFEADEAAKQHALEVDGRIVSISAVSMGNPHAVLDWPALQTAPLATLGASISRHPRFPRQTNVEFMHIVDAGHIELRVFERGVGETRACGTGACAAMAAGRRLGILDETVTAKLPGGSLEISWKGPGHELFMSGPAVDVYGGHIEL